MSFIQKKTLYIILIVSLFSLIVNRDAYSQSSDNKVYIIIVNRITIDDIYTMKTLKNLAQNGLIGIMNTKGFSSYNNPGSYLTINCSAKAKCNYECVNFYDINDYNKILYKRITDEYINNYEIAYFDMNKLLILNENNTFTPNIGALGDSIHEKGLKTAVFGNSDTADKLDRKNCLITMDSKGLIDFGNIDDILISEPLYPYGIKTNYNKIINNINDIKKEASLIVIETGDLNRLYSYKKEIPNALYKKYRNIILKDIDNFIKNLVYNVDRDNSRVFIISPNSGDDNLEKQSKLTPIIVWGDRIKQGVTYTSTTRTEGIVSNIDIAPSIAEYLNTTRDSFTGNNIKVINKADNLNYIKGLSYKKSTVSTKRYPILKNYAIFIITLLIFNTFVLLYNIKLCKYKHVLNKLFLLSILILPSMFLLTGQYVIKYNILNIFICTLLISIASNVYREDKSYIFFICATTYFIITFDLLFGAELIKNSIIGYDAIIGARYFGIGNELSGILVGSTLIFSSMLLNKINNRYVIYLLLFGTVFIFSSPNIGANVGATLSMFTASIYFVLRNSTYKFIDKKTIILFLCIPFIFVLLIGLMDIFINTQTTHLGNFIIETYKGGFRVLHSVLLRKIATNIRLINRTIWSKVLFVQLIIMFLIIILLKDKIKLVIKKNKDLFIGFKSCIVAEIVGFLMNDSGLVLSSFLNVFVVIPLIYVTINNE